MHVFTVIGPEGTQLCLAEARRPFEHRVEHRGEVAGRGIDDLQYLRGCGLLSESLITLGGVLGQPLLRMGEFALEVGDNLLRIG